MGAAASAKTGGAQGAATGAVKVAPTEWSVRMGWEDGEIQQDKSIIEHYMPPTFPLEAFLDPVMMAKCRKTWTSLMAGDAEGMRGNTSGRAGVVLFYDEFFFRLFKRAKVFLEIFDDPIKRGEVLVKAFGFMLRLAGDDSEMEQRRLFYLGKSHRFKNKVRPWHFAIYTETALETLMFWMGSDADVETGESWTCLVAYTLRGLLQAYLVDKVLPDEWYNNIEIDAVRKILTQSVHSRYNGSQGQPESQMSETDAAMQEMKKNSQEAEGTIKEEDEATNASEGDEESVAGNTVSSAAPSSVASELPTEGKGDTSVEALQ